MKKIILATLALAISTISFAEFKIIIPLERSNNGALENGTIKFINKQPTAPSENWMAIAPLESEWVNVGEPFNCTNWSPEPITVALGETFTQTATDCEQNQNRTIQQREQETITLAIRNVGIPVYENKTIVSTDTRDVEGTLDPWEAFADARSLSKDWNMLLWSNQNLTEIPNSPYPLTSIDTIYLYNNQLKNVDGLSNITSVDTIYLSENQLTNVDGLRNLTSVNSILLYNNQLTNVDGLSNITSVTNIHLYHNQLTNVDGIRNVKASEIVIDKTYSGPKLAASTRFCSLNTLSVFARGYAQKSQLCEQ